MASAGRELRSWGVLGLMVVLVAAALALRPGTSEQASNAEPTAPVVARAPAPSDSDVVGGPNLPLSGDIDPPTPAPPPSEAPAAPSPTPPAVAAAPSAPPQAPAPPASTPVPIHDGDPVLLTEERVDGAFGQTLTIGGYRVRAVRKATPVSDGCIQSHAQPYEVFDLTLTYTGPIFNLQMSVDEPTSFWCVEGPGDATVAFPSGVTRQVIVGYEDGYVGADAPFVVWITPVNGPHYLTFAFH